MSMTDYSMIRPQLARVILAFTGDYDKQEIQDTLCQRMKFLAAPVENSFRTVQEGVAIGFLRSNRPVRAVKNDNELRAGYKVMSSNILMDNSDETLWEVKSGAAGRYLARKGQEDLSDLIEASTNHRSDIPKIHQISLATAARHEFVAFASTSGDMEYGFCVASNPEKMRVVSFATRQPTIVQASQVASIHRIKTPRSVHNKIVKAGISREDKNQQIEYYKQLFGYSPTYLAEVIDMIEHESVA